MFLSPKITTNSLYFHGEPQTPSLQAGTVVTHQPAQYTVCLRGCLRAHKGDGPCVQQTGCARGEAAISGESHTPRQPYQFCLSKGEWRQKSSLIGERHPETGFSPANDGTVKVYQTGWSVVFLECKPLFILNYILLVIACKGCTHPILGIMDKINLKCWSIDVNKPTNQQTE